MSVNCVVISGNIGRDPELRNTRTGTPILSFSVAVNDRVKDRDGNWTDRPNWVDCLVFGSRSESLARYLSKGSKVAVAGKLRYSSWERDGQRRSKLEVVADDIEFLSRDLNSAEQRREHAPVQGPETYYDDEIPF